MTDVADVSSLLLAEPLESLELCFGFHSLSERRVVHALVAGHGPAVMPLALAVMFGMIRAAGMDDAS